MPPQILPRSLLEAEFNVSLQFRTDFKLEQLEKDLSAAYYTLFDYWITPTPPTPLDPPTVQGIMNAIPPHLIHREQLITDQDNIFAEIITLIKRELLFIVYLRLLPSQLPSPITLDYQEVCALYAKNLCWVHERLVDYAHRHSCSRLIASFYNPNLINCFKTNGYVALDVAKSPVVITALTRMQLIL